MPSYLSLFCRLALGLLFLYSFASKARSLPRFRESVRAFRLLPPRLTGPVAAIVLAAELAAGSLVLLGGPALGAGYALAAALLLLFTGVLVVALLRRPGVGCGCFGSDERPVAPADLVRNAGLLALATAGWWVARGTPGPPLGAADGLVLALAALSFLLVWTQLSEIVELFGRGNRARPGQGLAYPGAGWPSAAPEPSKEVAP